MVNMGAIMSASLLLYMVRPEMSVSEKFEFVQDFFVRLAGGEHVGFQNSVLVLSCCRIKSFTALCRCSCRSATRPIGTTLSPTSCGRTTVFRGVFQSGKHLESGIN